MLARLRQLIGLVLVPTLLVVGASSGVYALFECSMTGSTQSHCCCGTQAEAPEAHSEQIERASCCSERTFELEAPKADFAPSALIAPAAQGYVRLRLRDLYAPLAAFDQFVVREAPRAIGPPLILLYRVLRL